MPLINGRGQLGEALLKYDNELSMVDVYHTWNFLDKSEQVQKLEFEKLKLYLSKKNNNNKTIFISTSVENESCYLKYKRLSEELLLNDNANNLIIRFPNIIGKGIFTKLCLGLAKPYGMLEFVSILEAVNFLIKNKNNSQIIICHGWKVPAETLLEIIKLSNKLNLNRI